MLRLLINTLRPTEAQLRKRKPSSSLKMKMWLHRCLVKMLAHFYRQYAVHDILSMGNGTIVEIEIRDPGFEHEVACAKMDTRTQLQPVNVPAKNNTSKSSRTRWFYACFDWQHKVTVHGSTNKSLVIDHTARTTLAGNLKATVSQAKPSAMINTVKLTLSPYALRTSQPVPTEQEYSAPDRPSRSTPGRRRRVPPPSIIPETVVPNNDPPKQQEDQPKNKRLRTAPPNDIPQPEKPPMAVDEPTKPADVPVPPRKPLKKMKGFDMDDSF